MSLGNLNGTNYKFFVIKFGQGFVIKVRQDTVKSEKKIWSVCGQ